MCNDDDDDTCGQRKCFANDDLLLAKSETGGRMDCRQEGRCVTMMMMIPAVRGHGKTSNYTDLLKV